jgi:hypothetical protein
MTMIKEGDRVRHSNPLINGGLDMPVLAVEDGKALCTHLRAKDRAFVDDWMDLKNLSLVSEGEGRFKNQGER